MRILGGKDYYDGAGMGVDREVVFLRKTKPEVEVFPQFRLPRTRSLTFWDGRCQMIEDLTPYLVLLAGEAWPFFLHSRRARFSWERGTPAEERHILTEAKMAEEVVARISGKSWIGDWRDATDAFGRPLPPRLSVEAFLGLPREALMSWAIERRVITAVVRNVREGERLKERPETVFEANGCGLGELGFMRVMDPATAHMRIANFISGVLPQSREIFEIRDADRIRKAGFDKTSFRDWKGKKKPRRQSVA